MKESDLAYVGALFDYYGYLFIRAPKIRSNKDFKVCVNCKTDSSYDYNIHLNIYVGVYGVKKLIDLFNMGQVSHVRYMIPKLSDFILHRYGRRADTFWKISGANIQTFLSEICPFVEIKKPELMLGLEFFEDKKRTLNMEEKIRRCWYSSNMNDMRNLSEKVKTKWVGHGRRAESFRQPTN